MERRGGRPVARTRGLVVKALQDEVLVYDLERHQAHRLNGLAAAVWRACDGTHEVTTIAAVVSAETGQPVLGEAVRYALASLGRARLLTAPVEDLGLSRRDLIRRVGTAAAVALPLVTSIAVPSAAAAQSCIPVNSPCTQTSECCVVCAPVQTVCLGGTCGCLA
jgi:Coenzyme PQQ synthesis protein D (PqqD)